MQTKPFTPTPEDYIAYNLHYTQTNETARKSTQRMRVQCTLLVFLGGNVYLSLLSQMSVVTCVGYALLAAVIYMILPHVMAFNIRTKVRRMLKLPANAGALAERVVSTDAHGLRVVGGGEDSFYAFADIQAVTPWDKHVFIKVGDMAAVIVPRTAFTDDMACRNFIDDMRAAMAQN